MVAVAVAMTAAARVRGAHEADDAEDRESGDAALARAELYVERKDGEEVDPVERAAEEGAVVGRRRLRRAARGA